MKEETDILLDEKPETITLRDGKEYRLPIMDLTTLSNMQKSMKFKIRELKAKMDDDPIETSKMLAYALLKENYPDITPEKAGRLVRLGKEMNLLAEVLTKLFEGNYG